MADRSLHINGPGASQPCQPDSSIEPIMAFRLPRIFSEPSVQVLHHRAALAAALRSSKAMTAVTKEWGWEAPESDANLSRWPNTDVDSDMSNELCI
ncbi:hypothetical protein PTI98_001877 [Pleurotus ostreatus]|nr:hypothetical protein PTI98_001877 [Pleurotus ostreatus]